MELFGYNEWQKMIHSLHLFIFFFLSTFYQRKESPGLINTYTPSAFLKPGKRKFQSFWHCCYCWIHFKLRIPDTAALFNILISADQIKSLWTGLDFYLYARLVKSHTDLPSNPWFARILIMSDKLAFLFQLFLWIYINSFSDTVFDLIYIRIVIRLF